MGGRKPGSASSTPTAAASSSSSSGPSSSSKTSPSQSPNVSSTTSLASSKVFSNCSASSSTTADQSFIEANSRFTEDCNILFIIACWSRSEVGKKLDRTFIPAVSTKPSFFLPPIVRFGFSNYRVTTQSGKRVAHAPNAPKAKQRPTVPQVIFEGQIWRKCD